MDPAVYRDPYHRPWSGGSRSSNADLWITIPIAVLASLLAICLVLPVLLHRYCRQCMQVDACCGPYFAIFERMLGGMNRRARETQHNYDTEYPIDPNLSEMVTIPMEQVDVWKQQKEQPAMHQGNFYYAEQQTEYNNQINYNQQFYQTTQHHTTLPYPGANMQAAAAMQQQQHAVTTRAVAYNHQPLPPSGPFVSPDVGPTPQFFYAGNFEQQTQQREFQQIPTNAHNWTPQQQQQQQPYNQQTPTNYTFQSAVNQYGY